MGNMSYCRFENTYIDFRDCTNVLGEALDNDEPLTLSSHEMRALRNM